MWNGALAAIFLVLAIAWLIRPKSRIVFWAAGLWNGYRPQQWCGFVVGMGSLRPINPSVVSFMAFCGCAQRIRISLGIPMTIRLIISGPLVYRRTQQFMTGYKVGGKTP